MSSSRRESETVRRELRVADLPAEESGLLPGMEPNFIPEPPLQKATDETFAQPLAASQEAPATPADSELAPAAADASPTEHAPGEPSPPPDLYTAAFETLPRNDAPPGLRKTLARMERTLEEIRASIDAASRARQHKEFSSARLIGAVLQVLVVGLVLLSIINLVFEGTLGWVLAPIAFALVLQLGVLTAFVLAGQDSGGSPSE